MNKSWKTAKRHFRILHYILVLAVIWTVLVGSFLSLYLYEEYKHTIIDVETRARESINKDIVFRRWAAGHGGVYVSATKETPPNPYLSHVPERDIVTPSGRLLTLINPAYMIRLLHEFGQKQSDIRGHLTSLNPLNPRNVPDSWEAEALRAFERGKTEVSSVETKDGESYLRLMLPLITERGCLKCHAAQGYKEGDIRGGISVSVLFAPILAIERSSCYATIIGYIVLWVLGLVGMVLAGRRIEGQIRERELFEETRIRFLAILDATPDLVGMATPGGQVIHINVGGRKLLGIGGDGEVSGKKLSDFHPGWATDLILSEGLPAAIRDGTWAGETALLGRDGEEIPVSQVILSHRAPDGSVEYLTTVARDLTKQKQMENELRAERDLFIGGPTVVFSWKAREGWPVEYVSPNVSTQFGYDPEDFTSGRIPYYTSVVHPDDLERVVQEVMAHSRSGVHSFEQEYRIARADGRYVWIYDFTFVARNLKGAITHYHGYILDISERKRGEERLAKLKECFLGFSPDSRENIDRLVAVCGELLGGDSALYNRLDQGLLSSWGQWKTPPDYNPVDKPEGHICYDVIRHGTDEVVVLRNLPETRYAQTDPCVIPYGLQTYVGRAVKLGGRPVGSVCVVYQHDLVPSEDDKKCLGIIAASIEVEEERFRATEMIRETSKTLQNIIAGTSIQETLKSACDAVVEMGYAMCWVGLAEPDYTIRPIVASGFEEGYLDKVRIRWDDSLEGSGPAGTAIRTGRTRIISNIQENATFAHWREDALMRGYRSMAAIPFQSEGNEIRGSFNVYRKHEGNFSQEEILNLETFVHQSAVAIISSRRIEEIKDVKKRLESHIQHLPMGYIVWDREFRVQEWNPAAEKIFDWSAAEALGRHAYELIMPPEAQPYVNDVCAKLLESDEASHSVDDNIRKDGAKIICEWFDTLLRDGSGNVIGVLSMVHDVTEKIKIEEDRRRLAMAVEQSADHIIVTDREGTIQYVNPAFERTTGYSAAEVVGKNPRVLRSGKHDEAFYRELWDTLTRGEVWTGRFINRKKDGLLIEEDATISPLRDSSGEIVNYVAAKRDVTKLVLLERQVRMAQKMESVGTLAGGIAHDFNNTLTGIIGFVELLRNRIAGDKQALHDLDVIMRCAERATTLTRQLLTYARRQIIEPVNLNLSTLVAELMKLIGKVVGEHIEVATYLGKNVPTIYVDRGQIEQVVMNLCLNARDAMPKGGRLVVETEDVYLEEEYVRQNLYMRTGRYALLTVSDTGIGMDEKTRERVFDPFFTTKGPDKGTGLGLAMVYGIVKQHGGFIHLYTEPGKGTAFKVYFPAIKAQPDAVPEKRREEIVRGGMETILLAEDEEVVRSFIEQTLKELGYNVLVARNGEEAIEIFRRNKEIALVVLDLVMPRKGGEEAFEEMHKENPRLKTIFMSGYTSNGIHKSCVLNAGVPFLQKPFGPTILARKIREVLDTQ